jgi:hypothetical protein
MSDDAADQAARAVFADPADPCPLHISLLKLPQCHRKRKNRDRRKTWPVFTDWQQSQLRQHTPIPQNFVALHGMGVGRCMNGRVAGLLIR